MRLRFIFSGPICIQMGTELIRFIFYDGVAINFCMENDAGNQGRIARGFAKAIDEGVGFL